MEGQGMYDVDDISVLLVQKYTTFHHCQFRIIRSTLIP